MRPVGPVGAPGAFEVKDANNTTAGVLLALHNGPIVDFYFHGFVFNADANTGARTMSQLQFDFESNDCTGPPLTFSGRALLQQAFRSPLPADTDVYQYGVDRGPTRMLSRFLPGNPVCQSLNFTTNLQTVVKVPDADVPPALVGPLSFAPAG